MKKNYQHPAIQIVVMNTEGCLLNASDSTGLRADFMSDPDISEEEEEELKASYIIN